MSSTRPAIFTLGVTKYMPDYDPGFAEKMALAADLLDEKCPYNYDSHRAIVYICRVSIELSLKAILEAAGVPAKEIRARNHSLTDLVSDLDHCEVLTDTTAGSQPCWESAATALDQCIDLGMVKVPIREFINAKEPEVSKYPNQVRYGDTVIDYRPVFLIGASKLLAHWAIRHSSRGALRKKSAV